MDEYKPNSNLSKAQKPESTEVAEPAKLEKVVNGPVKVKKRSGIKKMADEFIKEDAESVKSYIFMDILLPAMKKAISDVISNGVDMLLYGETRGGRRNNSSTSRISYRSYYDDRDDRRRDYNRPSRRSGGYDFDEFVMERRGDAEAVLDTMVDILDRYGVVRVTDFYELMGERGNYTDNKYGWTDLRNTAVKSVRGGGYIIDLPRPTVID